MRGGGETTKINCDINKHIKFTSNLKTNESNSAPNKTLWLVIALCLEYVSPTFTGVCEIKYSQFRSSPLLTDIQQVIL